MLRTLIILSVVLAPAISRAQDSAEADYKNLIETEVKKASNGDFTDSGKMASLRKGQEAPFDGYLLDMAALGKILAQLDLADAECDIRCEKEVAIARAEMQLQLDLLTAERDMWKTRYDDFKVLDLEEDAYYEKLLQQKTRPRLEGPAFAGGVAVGILGVIIGSFGIASLAQSFTVP